MQTHIGTDGYTKIHEVHVIFTITESLRDYFGQTEMPVTEVEELLKHYINEHLDGSELGLLAYIESSDGILSAISSEIYHTLCQYDMLVYFKVMQITFTSPHTVIAKMRLYDAENTPN